MVTYPDLIQTGILIVGIVALFIQANQKEQPPFPGIINVGFALLVRFKLFHCLNF